MEEGRKPPPESTSPTEASFLSEVRLESSPAAIGFSDSCPCCGNKKRRCLQPTSSFFRKKLLVFDRSPDSASASPSLASSPSLPPSGPNPPPPPSSVHLCSDPVSPMSPPPPLTPSQHPPPVPSASPPTPLDWSLERCNSSITAEEKAVYCTAAAEGKKEEDGGAGAAEEVRVCVRCRCGVVRRIVLVRG